MDNLENYLYLVFAVIYIISRIIKGKPKNQEAPRRPSRPVATPVFETETAPKPAPKKTMSFEDILKEFEKNLTGMPAEEPQPVPEPRRQITFEERDRTERSEYESYEGVEYEDSSPSQRLPLEYEKYQTTAYEDSNFQHALSYDLDLDKRLEFIRSSNYEIQNNRQSEFIRMLKESGGAKNAIVLGEIINRKYF